MSKMKKKIINEILIERMNQLKNEGNVPLDEIEKAIGISKGSLSKYMSGTHLPNSEVVRKLSTYWHVSADYLLGSSPDKSIYSDDGKCIPNTYLDVVNDAIKCGITAEELREVYETAKKFKGIR
jgi:transcriptional regulator with XRE-family HTH domain